MVPFLASANHYFVCATLTRDAEPRWAGSLGDLLVCRASAWAHDGAASAAVPGRALQPRRRRNHFELLNHPAIYEQIAAG